MAFFIFLLVKRLIMCYYDHVKNDRTSHYERSLLFYGGGTLDIAGKEKYISWGVSFGIHFCLLMVAAAMGLFAVAAPQDKRPIDVEIYDTAAPEGDPGPAAAAEAAPPAPSIDDIPFEKPKKEPEQQPQERPADTPKQQSSTSSSTSNTSTQSQGTGESKTPTGGGGNSNGGGGNGTGRDAAAAQRPKTPPQFLSGATPVYPPDLERKGITGTVGLSIIVGPDGSVQSASVSSSSGQPALDQAAITAAYTYRFEPARNIYDEPVACRINRSFSFS